MQTTLNKSLNEFVGSVRNDPVVKMPKDGTVHELTSNVMMMLERLLAFVDMVKPLCFIVRRGVYVTVPRLRYLSLLQQVGNVLVVPDLRKLSKAEDRNRCTLSQYVHLVLSALSLNINNKAVSYTDEYLQV